MNIHAVESLTLLVKFLILLLPGATTGPSVLWSRVQMSSLTPAREPTNTWRSSMNVCPTVSLTFLSLNKTITSSPPFTHPSTHSSSPLVIVPLRPPYIARHPSLCPVFLCETRSGISFSFSLYLCHTMNLSWNMTREASWPSSAMPLLLMCSPCFPRTSLVMRQQNRDRTQASQCFYEVHQVRKPQLPSMD